MNQPDDELRTPAPDGRPSYEQPAWRKEFPIDIPQDFHVARRDFTKFLGLTSLAFMVGQIWIVLKSWFRARREPVQERFIVALEQLPVGGALVFDYPEEGDACILLRPEHGPLLAYSQKCTHLCCAVIPKMDQKQLHCPCHHGYFDLDTGRPIAGPPRRPLPKITLEVRDNGQVHATGVELRTV